MSNKLSLQEQAQEQEQKKNNKNNTVRFTPPTVEQVREYCAARGNNVDAQSFVDFYESKGWMIGKNAMKDWRAAVRTWEKNERKSAKQNAALRYEQTQISEKDFNEMVVNLDE